MRKTIPFLKLEYQTIKPYITVKNVVVYALILVYMLWMNPNPMVASGIIFMIVQLYISYPFALADNNHLDSLYINLNLSRREVVLGRYQWMIVMNLFASLVAFGVGLILSIVLKMSVPIDEMLGVIAVIACLFIFVELIQIPIYFKYGYMNAKLIIILPFVFLGLLFYIMTRYLQGVGTLLMHIGLPLVFALAVCLLLAVAFISLRLSLKFYQEKDF